MRDLTRSLHTRTHGQTHLTHTQTDGHMQTDAHTDGHVSHIHRQTDTSHTHTQMDGHMQTDAHTDVHVSHIHTAGTIHGLTALSAQTKLYRAFNSVNSVRHNQ